MRIVFDTKIYVKIPGQCHNHEARAPLSPEIPKDGDEEQIRTPQTPHMKSQTHKEELQQRFRF